jgi:hypothetical protein
LSETVENSRARYGYPLLHTLGFSEIITVFRRVILIVRFQSRHKKMTTPFPSDRFQTSAELLKRLQERSDDFESVQIMVENDMTVIGPQGQQMKLNNCCSLIKTCTGESLTIHRDELQVLLNDGILQRLKIPIVLIPREAQ